MSSPYGRARCIPLVETKHSLGDIISHKFAESCDILVKRAAHVFVIGEYERLVWVKPYCNYVLTVVMCVANNLIDSSLFREQEFLI